MKKVGFLLLLTFGFGVSAQNNIQFYTPSLLFDKGDWELKTYQNVYSQTKSFGSGALEKIETGRGRETYSTSINQFLFGFSDQINLGLDLWIKNVNLENGPYTSRTVVSGIGPKIKIAPFKQIKRLSIQSTFLFPVSADMEGRSAEASHPFLFVETDRSLWLTQFFYDLQLNPEWQLFFQMAFWQNFVRDSFRINNFLQSQTTAFVSYFPTSRWTIFGMTEYFPTHYNDQTQDFSVSFSYFIQSGLGIKYQLVPNLLELEAMYTNFWAGSEFNGAGSTFNIGVRLVRQ
jgi:hypothetical protein